MSEPVLERLSQHEIVGQAAMSAVRTHIQTHLDNALPVAGLAAVAGLSPFHFARKFKTMVGMPPHSYVTKMRIERACLLLAETDVPLREIARDLGYSDQSGFTKVFGDHMGMPPGAYRRVTARVVTPLTNPPQAAAGKRGRPAP